jgi:bifunctional DNA-binding transcriptional regulator/antitoxin component of YhaV-PrlF toxin-antitoxin module
MLITHISENEQIIISEHICQAKHWNPGQKLVITETEDGILLKPASPFKSTKLDDVARCLPYQGKAKNADRNGCRYCQRRFGKSE